jgi:hypothetical protein
MQLLLVVKADENDGDYVIKNTWIRDSSMIPLIKKVAEAVRNSSQGHNWDTSEYRHNDELRPSELYERLLTQAEITIFEDYVPGGEYGIHTIVSIELYEIANIDKLL